ncbi:lantibiotic dehydratase [Micromonospora sp. WMMD710]|uniref:lantibiotic dehydratase n=1 Tax=Micromonospora sp. WMMD710 TaxID=3016085 RepID=UPI002415AD49|nr:lantibiotic dehydratase [Micromonospora sp. WMMD710]MDG4760195.1 lantibiotic dehydratase [Micromonospora sp. WMMD710]
MDVVFTCTEQFVLRAAALPRSAARGTRAAPVDVRNVVADPVAAPFSEAVGLASRSLDATFAKVAHSQDLPDRRADRAADSLTRYLLRMSGRAGDRAGTSVGRSRVRRAGLGAGGTHHPRRGAGPPLGDNRHPRPLLLPRLGGGSAHPEPRDPRRGLAGDRRAAEPFTARLREHLHAFAEPESMIAVRTVPADWAGLLDGAAGVALALGGTSPGGPVLRWDGALLLS